MHEAQLAVDAHDLLAWLQDVLLDLVGARPRLRQERVRLVVVVELDGRDVHGVCHCDLLHDLRERYRLVEVLLATEGALLLLRTIIESHADGAEALVELAELDLLQQAAPEVLGRGVLGEAMR